MLDPGFSSILLRACHDAIWLATELGETQLADMSHQHVTQLTESLNARSDAQGLVWALDLITDQEHRHIGAGAALNLLREDLPKTAVDFLARAVTEGTLSSRCGIRSLARAEESYDALNYWRGPVWANISWLCGLGLKEHGRYVAAGAMLDSVERFATVGNWPECINPDKQQGLGAEAFSWSAALTMWIRRPKRETGTPLPLL
jgi:glycogen debranching enzyme